ncbi:MAG: radical SAM protein [bacterium]|nr:radical SAM protein [bacterium]
MAKCTVITSLCSGKDMTQAGAVYLCTALTNAGLSYRMLDLSSSLDYSNTPKELNTKCTSPNWLNPNSIKYGDWMNDYLPKPTNIGEYIFFSSLYSPDVVFHARLSYNIKKSNPNAITVIGGCAIVSLQKEQLKLLSEFFNYILIGHDIKYLLNAVIGANQHSKSNCTIIKKITPPSFQPDYSLLPLNDLVTVYSGHGCYYGKCSFCDYPSRSYQKVVFRSANKVAIDVNNIFQLQPKIKDIVLTQDSYSKKYLNETVNEIARFGGKIPYNLMLRAETWVTDELGENLAKSGCTDVFIGAEALDEEILAILNKGLGVEKIKNAIKILSKFVKVTIGLILFVPGISEKSLITQLKNIEMILPYLYHIEPEILTIVNGSAFALNPSKFGIKLYEAKNPINNSWCFGLSHDIPWSMRDANLMRQWFYFFRNLKELCINHVKPGYWQAIEVLEKKYKLAR